MLELLLAENASLVHERLTESQGATLLAGHLQLSVDMWDTFACW